MWGADSLDKVSEDKALGMKYPAELYVSSSRPYKGLSNLEYPFHDRSITVTHCGRLCIGRRKINLSTVFAGQLVTMRPEWISFKWWAVKGSNLRPRD